MHPLLYIIIVPIGWLWLHIRYPQEVRTSVLNQDYEGSYAHAGYILALRLIFFSVLLAVLVLAFAAISAGMKPVFSPFRY